MPHEVHQLSRPVWRRLRKAYVPRPDITSRDINKHYLVTQQLTNTLQEYHLQQAINAAQASVSGGRFKEAHIPTPPTIASNVQYHVLYPARFEQPATYIRSSSTVEDHCNGSLYCMDEADEIALQKINAHLPSEVKSCSEDQFEEVMSFFEETVHTKQPYATLDDAPVLPLEDFQDQLEEAAGSTVRQLAKHVYEHWRSRRLDAANHNLPPSLKVSKFPTVLALPAENHEVRDRSGYR
jgi:enhancer of polycomb-like protein